MEICSLFGGSLGLNLLGISSVLLLVSSLLLLEVLGEELLVGDSVLLTGLPVLNLGFLVDGLSSESLLGDESLDLGGLEESLVALLDFSSDNVLSHVILLLEHECFSNVVSSLGSESSGLGGIVESLNFLLSLDNGFKSNNGEVGSGNASSDRLSLSLSVSSGSVGGGS